MMFGVFAITHLDNFRE